MTTSRHVLKQVLSSQDSVIPLCRIIIPQLHYAVMLCETPHLFWNLLSISQARVRGQQAALEIQKFLEKAGNLILFTDFCSFAFGKHKFCFHGFQTSWKWYGSLKFTSLIVPRIFDDDCCCTTLGEQKAVFLLHSNI